MSIDQLPMSAPIQRSNKPRDDAFEPDDWELRAEHHVPASIFLGALALVGVCCLTMIGAVGYVLYRLVSALL
jgi:hypothetical protein